MNTRLLLVLSLIPLAGLSHADDRRPLFADDEAEVCFKLKDKNGDTPHLVLFTREDQAGTADSINYWRSTQDPANDGVAVEFKGIRFLRSPDMPDDVVVRLVGIKNELELREKISLDELQSGRPRKLHFGPAALGFGPISGTTDADMTLRYDPRHRTLAIPEVSGQLEWKRPFYEAQKDAGSLHDIVGEIGEVPLGGMILKPLAK